jgi:hypothetical protein
VAILLGNVMPKADVDAVAHSVLALLAAEHLHAVVADLGEVRVRDATLAVVAGLLESSGSRHRA